MKETIQEQICAALITRGCIKLVSKTGKAKCFSLPKNDEKFLFVGKKGSVRIGPNYSNSHPISNRVKRRLLEK